MYLCILYLLYCHLSVATVYILIGRYIYYIHSGDWLAKHERPKPRSHVSPRKIFANNLAGTFYRPTTYAHIYKCMGESTCMWITGSCFKTVYRQKRLVCPLYSLKMLVTAYVCISWLWVWENYRQHYVKPEPPIHLYSQASDKPPEINQPRQYTLATTPQVLWGYILYFIYVWI